MQKSDIRILVIEDDPSLGQAIETALQRAGYTTFLAQNYTAAKSAFSLNDYRGLVVDCMLPQKSGVDTAQELQQESHQDLVVILTSGVFKTRTFAHDAKLRAKARAFLQKPFDIAELVQHFDDAFASEIEQARAPLYDLLQTAKYSRKDRVNAINRTEYIHGFDLPFVYSMLMDPKISGELEIQYNENVTSYIGFNQGRIDKVQHHDTDSYFGTLIVEKGFATFEEVEEGLQLVDDKPIGQRLVDASVLSPHAVAVVQKEQMVIRISKTIQDTSVKIAFREMPKPEPGVCIETVEFTQLLSDWICSKVSLPWLKSFYHAWEEVPLLQGDEFFKLNLIKSLPAIKPVANLFQSEWPSTPQEMLQAHPQNEEDILRALHFLLVQRIFVFSPRTRNTTNFEAKRARLQKMWETMQYQNHFEVFGLSTKARTSEINRAYMLLAKNLHPDKLEPSAPADIRDLVHKVFARITEAYQTLEDETRRNNYIKTLEMGHAEEILKAESAFDEGYRKLQNGRYRDARKIFEKTMRMKGARADTMVYLIWALIREKKATVDNHALAEKVSSLLSQVPHEDRHSPAYFFVRGLYYELIGEMNKAYKHFKHAVALDPNFSEARREINILKSRYGRQRQTFTDELSQVVTKLFRRKSG